MKQQNKLTNEQRVNKLWTIIPTVFTSQTDTLLLPALSRHVCAIRWWLPDAGQFQTHHSRHN